jgi:hypothetical protein
VIARLRRLHGWMRAGLLLYLAGALILVAAHQHRDAAQAHDCALCVVAHMATAMPAAPAPVPPPAIRSRDLPIPEPEGYESPATPVYRGRAPPQA